MKYTAALDGENYEIELLAENGVRRVRLNGEERPVDFRLVRGRDSFSLLVGDRSYPVSFERRPDGLSVTVEEEAYLIRVEDERTRVARELSRGKGGRDHDRTILSMMPGIVREVRAEPGKEVKAGDALLILEAMKMENEIRSAIDGVVKKVHVRPEQTVNKGDALVTLE